MTTDDHPAFRAVSWNAWIGQDATDDRDPDDLADNVEAMLEAAGRPPVACLQEVSDWREPIRFGYVRVQAPRDRFPHPEARSTQLLVRRDVEVLGHGARQAYGPWWEGPKHGTPHPPRVMPRVTVRWPGVGALDAVGVHRTRPAWSTDGLAYRGEAACLVDWNRDRPPGRPQVWLGDWNEPSGASGLVMLADRLQAGVWLRGIDGFLVHGLAVAGVRRLPGKFGGDGHRPVHIRLVGRP